MDWSFLCAADRNSKEMASENDRKTVSYQRTTKTQKQQLDYVGDDIDSINYYPSLHWMVTKKKKEDSVY